MQSVSGCLLSVQSRGHVNVAVNAHITLAGIVIRCQPSGNANCTVCSHSYEKSQPIRLTVT